MLMSKILGWRYKTQWSFGIGQINMSNLIAVCVLSCDAFACSELTVKPLVGKNSIRKALQLKIL